MSTTGNKMISGTPPADQQPLSGDITGTAAGTVVTSIQGHPLTAPTPADAGKVLTYDPVVGWILQAPGTGTGGDVNVTNWPASQPVTAAALPLPAGAATDATLASLAKDGAAITGAAMPAGGSGTQGWLSAVWKAITDRLPAALVNNRLDVNVGAGAVSVSNFPGTQPVSGTVTANAGTLPALTRGTQGTTGYSVQALKDAGRSVVFLQIDNIAAVAVEALVVYGGWRGGAALTAGTGAYTVTAGKTLRLEKLVVVASGTVLATLRVRVRALATTVALTSPVYLATGIVTPASSGQTSEVSLADGVEIPAGFQMGISAVGVATQVFSCFVVAYEY